MQYNIFNKAILAKNIKDLLSEKKLKQWQLAEATGISQSTICRYTKELIKKPNKNYISAIAHHFKVNIPWLLLGEGPKDAIEEEINSADFFDYPKEGPLYECLEMCRELLALDRKAFFLIHASVAGVLSALKLMTEEGIDQFVERRHGERRSVTGPIELERRRADRRRVEDVSFST